MMYSALRQSGNMPGVAHTTAKFLFGFVIALFLLGTSLSAHAQEDTGPGGGHQFDRANVTAELQHAYITSPSDSSDGLLHGIDTGYYSNNFPGTPTVVVASLQITLISGGNSWVVSTEVGMGAVNIDLTFDMSILSSGTYKIEWVGRGMGKVNGVYCTVKSKMLV